MPAVAVLVVRGEEDTTEFTDLAKTMGIDIVDVVKQRGREDPRTYLGRGRLDEVGDVLRSAPHGHAWHGVDLVLMHTNATPRQLVATSTVLGVEVWDRVRLLLALFTAHAASVEARTQVRIARLRSDRTVLRELISQETTASAPDTVVRVRRAQRKCWWPWDEKSRAFVSAFSGTRGRSPSGAGSARAAERERSVLRATRTPEIQPLPRPVWKIRARRGPLVLHA